jgi:hypothetical protein
MDNARIASDGVRIAFDDVREDEVRALIVEIGAKDDATSIAAKTLEPLSADLGRLVLG